MQPAGVVTPSALMADMLIVGLQERHEPRQDLQYLAAGWSLGLARYSGYGGGIEDQPLALLSLTSHKLITINFKLN